MNTDHPEAWHSLTHTRTLCRTSTHLHSHTHTLHGKFSTFSFPPAYRRG